MSHICVLLIEDNSGDALLISEFLKESSYDTYELTHVVRVSEASEYLTGDTTVDVIISDIALPDSQGTETFHKLRKFSADLPVIFFTGTHDESLALSALQKGAQDYLLKGKFDGDGLRRSIRYALERKNYQNEVDQAKTRARKLRNQTVALKKEREQLHQLNKAKDDFVSLASHQLRTPATGVKQYIGMVLEGLVGEPTTAQREMLENAYSSNERQLRIVNDLLKTAMIDSGKILLSKENVDVVNFLKKIVDEQKPTFKKRQQQLMFEPDQRKIEAEIDAHNLRMAIENMLDNARKYSNPGATTKISVSTHRTQLKISIEDEGVGIPKEDYDKVFDKFLRVSNPLSIEVGGSGLGLFWTHSIVELHGGTIKLHPSPSGGTTFIITLPLTEKGNSA